MDEPISLEFDRCSITLDPARLFDNSVPHIRKLLKLVFEYDWQNKDAIFQLREYLDEAVATSQKHWAESGKAYTDGYVDTMFRYDLAPKKLTYIRQQNKKLLTAVRNAKAEHVRRLKIRNYFEELYQNIKK